MIRIHAGLLPGLLPLFVALCKQLGLKGFEDSFVLDQPPLAHLTSQELKK